MPQVEITFHSRNALEALGFPALGIEQCWSPSAQSLSSCPRWPRQLNEGIKRFINHSRISIPVSLQYGTWHSTNLCPSDIPGHGIFCPHTEHLTHSSREETRCDKHARYACPCRSRVDGGSSGSGARWALYG
jgi:hypothetical protein